LLEKLRVYRSTLDVVHHFLLFGSKHLEEDWKEFLKQEPVDGLCSEEALLVELDLEQVFRNHILVTTWLAHHQFVST